MVLCCMSGVTLEVKYSSLCFIAVISFYVFFIWFSVVCVCVFQVAYLLLW